MSNFPKIQAILAQNVSAFEEQSKEQLIADIITVITYAKSLEAQSNTTNITGNKRHLDAVNVVTPPVVDMSPTLDSLKSIIQKQIKAQLKFSKSCKTGTAKWKFQGLCHSVEVFKALTGSDAKFKRKKISLDEFNKIIDCYDGISASIRYGTLSVNGDVSLNWDPNSLEFSFSGTYGV